MKNEDWSKKIVRLRPAPVKQERVEAGFGGRVKNVIFTEGGLGG